MRIYYRGYVINEEIPSINYSVYGQRPDRQEVAATTTSREAMVWIDRDVNRSAILRATKFLQTASR